MKLFSTLILLLTACSCLALGFIPGSQVQVVPAQRDYSFAYHSGSDDFRLYGSDIWAVRFDFADVYPSLLEAEFSVERALLWLPQAGDSVKVELFSDIQGLPGQRLAQTEAEVNSNYLELPFPQAVQTDVIWLLVYYSTNFTNRYVSASNGGGSYSYFWNTNAQTPYFQSLATAGFNCELLFGVGGEFVLDGGDLELMSFDLAGEIAPREDVYPTFTIHNHSSSPIADASIALNFYTPLPDLNLSLQIQILETIEPHSTYTYNEQSAGYWQNLITLPDQPMQLKFRSELTSSLGDSDPVFNNISVIYRYSFIHPYPVYLVENFLRFDFAAPLLDLQAQYQHPEALVLNYFPILSDSLSSPGSAQRFNWYGFNSLPRTAINGEGRITGYSSAYGGQYNDLITDGIQALSLVSAYECRLVHLPASDAIVANITLGNDDTYLFNTATDYNLITNSRFFLGLYRKEVLSEGEYYVLDRWIAHASPLDAGLGFGESITRSYSFVLNDVDIADLAANYRLCYWLQLKQGGKILWSGFADFYDMVSNQDDLESTPPLITGSNPLRPGGILKLRLSDASSSLSLEIYNLKGQRILHQSSPQLEFKLSSEHFPASGIYLIRVGYRGHKGQTAFYNKKISVLK